MLDDPGVYQKGSSFKMTLSNCIKLDAHVHQVFFKKMTPVILLMLPEIRRSPVDMVIYPSIYRLSCMSGGAGFLIMDDFMVIFQRL